MANEFEITKVRLIIRQFLWETRKAVESAEAAQKWLIQFRNTLEYQELEENPDAYALAILAEARSFNNTKQRNQQMRWVRAALEKDGIKNPTDEQLEECWMELYGKTQEPKADAEIREDSENFTRGSNAASLESQTSAKTLNEARESRRTGTAVPELRRAAHSPAPVRMDRPKDREEFHAFVAENNLHEGLAEEWWDINERRGWVDIDGKPYKNWRGALKNYCNKTEAKRTA